ncbi:hypothetical protein BDZ45DRAFT_772495 [Acephala macrosclerotiorum]|nr:hypothetical protein BDZ45DRAFT_772495 [Acephala macrosclerotiorum]
MVMEMKEALEAVLGQPAQSSGPPNRLKTENILPNNSNTLNNTTSAFLDKLPLEIRLDIYELLLTSSILSKPESIANSWGSDIKYELSPSILRVCKQIHAEAQPVLYGSNTFYIECQDGSLEQNTHCQCRYEEDYHCCTPVCRGTGHSGCRMVSVDQRRTRRESRNLFRPLWLLRKVGRFSLKVAGEEDVYWVIGRESPDSIIPDEQFLPTASVQDELRKLVTGESPVESVKSMYRFLLRYSQSFERYGLFKMKMQLGPHQDRIIEEFGLEMDEYNELEKDTPYPFKGHPVELGLQNAKDCILKNTTVLFKEHPKYERVLPFDTQVLFTRYSRKLKAIYNSMEREVGISQMHDALEAENRNHFAKLFKPVFEDMENQYKEIRAARQVLFEADVEEDRGLDDGFELEPAGCEDGIDWTILELRTRPEGSPW